MPKVSVPYEITLLSNSFLHNKRPFVVSVPYEITLLSNSARSFFLRTTVSVPYEITLLSNADVVAFLPDLFQYLMKLHYSQTERASK